MPSRPTKRSAIRQRKQQRLVERGMKLPGVAEAMAVYGAVRSREANVGQAAPTIGYATGANR